MEPIYITGAGVVSAIGIGKSATLASLLAEQTGIGPMTYLPSRHRDIPVGEVKLSNSEMMQMLGVAEDPHLTRTALMGRLALREALEEASLTGDVLRLSVVDGKSGIATWTASVDGRFIVFDAIEKSNTYACELRESWLRRTGKAHQLRFEVTDNRQNTQTFETTFNY